METDRTKHFSDIEADKTRTIKYFKRGRNRSKFIVYAYSVMQVIIDWPRLALIDAVTSDIKPVNKSFNQTVVTHYRGDQTRLDVVKVIIEIPIEYIKQVRNR